MQSYRDDIPQNLRDFLAYHETIKAHSQKTVDEYYLDLAELLSLSGPVPGPRTAGQAAG